MRDAELRPPEAHGYARRPSRCHAPDGEHEAGRGRRLLPDLPGALGALHRRRPSRGGRRRPEAPRAEPPAGAARAPRRALPPRYGRRARRRTPAGLPRARPAAGVDGRGALGEAVEPRAFELNTSVSNLRHLRASDLGPYDAVYLGNIYCRRYEGNLLERPTELREAIRFVRAEGRRAYLTTYAAPRNDTLPVLRAALAAAAAEG